MGEQYPSQEYPQGDFQFILRDLEEKQRLLKDRILIIGKSIIDEKNRTFSELQQIKKDLFLLSEQHRQMRETINKIAEQIPNLARREELLIIQKQLDLLRSEG